MPLNFVKCNPTEVKSQLIARLDYVNASRQCRSEMATYILAHPEAFKPLLEIALQTHTDLGSRASWVVEFVIKKKPELLYRHLDYFTRGLGDLQRESSIRPMAKICELLTLQYYKPNHRKPPPLNRENLEQITSACFDWLISAEKVAPKAYSMQSLVLLGQEFKWVKGELKAVLEQEYARGSAGYKARARKILKELD
jgi:hypothetical protein